ncbi:hypothetical protein M9H77_07791 [Catharanthus roseus]|uniref:Uncharacterized protein n=1 Tax=Catharanthus roseus TaxID=4058 RepID=A0ACC0BW86_CATRO|nr:hypothetical protein M9H77_07791 [Catharanthus roseus]
MQGKNTVEEVPGLSAKRGYTVFYRNLEDSNVLSDIVVAHLTSIEMMRKWRYKTLEIGGRHPSAPQQDKDLEKRSLTDLLHQIRVLSPVLHEDPSVTLTSPPEVAVTKWRKKTNSIKRDKSHWEHLSIAHRKIQKSSGSGSGSGFGSGSRYVSWLGSDFGLRSRGRGRPPQDPSNWKNVIGDGNYGYQVVADFVFGDEHQWPEVRRRMLYELEYSMNVYLNLVGLAERVNGFVHRKRWQDVRTSYEHWLETPDSLYVIANAFNLCVILIAQLGSTTVLPLYLYLDRPGGTLVIGLLTEQQHLIQWLHSQHRCKMSPPGHTQQAARRTVHLTATLDH